MQKQKDNVVLMPVLKGQPNKFLSFFYFNLQLHALFLKNNLQDLRIWKNIPLFLVNNY